MSTASAPDDQPALERAILPHTLAPGTTGGEVRPLATDATPSAPRWQPAAGESPPAPSTPTPGTTRRVPVPGDFTTP